MALFSIPQLKAAAGLPVYLSATGRLNYARKSLSEGVHRFSEDQSFDIFLSHKFSDLVVVLGLQRTFEKYGYSVYVDSQVDRHLDRSVATKANARLLKKRMRQAKCLVVATTENFQQSVWIPWEVGYADGRNGLVAIAPVTAATTHSNEFKGSEYFALYPYVSEDGIDGKPGKKQLWVFEQADRYVAFSGWLGRKPFRDRPKKSKAIPTLAQALRRSPLSVKKPAR